MIVAISREMTPRSAKSNAETDGDTVFIGGARPTESDQAALARFGLDKNYRVVFPSFDLNDPSTGPIGFHVVVTDGRTVATTLRDGRLWKRDRRSAAVLVFPDIGAVVKLTSKRQMAVHETRRQFHDHGYDLAREAVRTHAAKEPGTVPVVSTIGNMLAVLDIKTMSNAFAAAE
ncbi:hypothetical protein U1708_02950 [Sphingomonas sp. ZB1N12]|uniref:hypothetical protein n=1 Tax=Sphingomonas arabinosi TaxID=3096160 RepID=UPI002FCAF3A5